MTRCRPFREAPRLALPLCLSPQAGVGHMHVWRLYNYIPTRTRSSLSTAS